MSDLKDETSGADSAPGRLDSSVRGWKWWLGRIIRWLIWTGLYVVILLWLLFVFAYNPVGRIFTWWLALLILGLSLAAGLVASLVVEGLIWLLGKVGSSLIN